MIWRLCPLLLLVAANCLLLADLPADCWLLLVSADVWHARHVPPLHSRPRRGSMAPAGAWV
jgi:hypothetical protein